jgi:predicted enzyme related to lactoylglutathione lyase
VNKNNIYESISTPCIGMGFRYEKSSIVFKTNDIKQKYHELKTKGVKFHKPPYDVVPGIRAAEFMDYEGNKLAMADAD